MLKDAGAPATADESISASRSLADELIDTVGEPVVPRKRLECPSCGSTEFNLRSSLGSTKINVCVKCNQKVYTKKKSFARSVATHGQGKGRGPIYSPSGPKTRPDKNSPTYRLKSKPRKKDE